MLRILIDENLDQRILRGLRRQLPLLDYEVVQELGFAGTSDESLLAWAAENQRILVTHDVNTVTKYAYERIGAGEQTAGVIVVPEDLAIGLAIEELLVLIECCEVNEMENQVKYIPL